jgi:hypothetical protein
MDLLHGMGRVSSSGGLASRVSVSAVMGDGGKFIGPGANSTPKAGGAGGAMGGPTSPAQTAAVSDSDSRSLSSLEMEL